MKVKPTYKLTEEDYRSLWLIASPYEIIHEFGEHSHSRRTIYRRFEKYGISGVLQHRRNLITRLSAKSAPGTPEGFIRRKIDEQLESAKNTAIRAIWVKIAEHEEVFGV